MLPDRVHAVLTAEEGALLERLRSVSPGPLRTSLVRLLLDLVSFAQQPSCAAAQADGVPCETASSTCERCRDAVAVLEEIDGALAGVLALSFREQRAELLADLARQRPVITMANCGRSSGPTE